MAWVPAGPAPASFSAHRTRRAIPSAVFGKERRPSIAPELSDTAAPSSLSFDTSIPRNSIRCFPLTRRALALTNLVDPGSLHSQRASVTVRPRPGHRWRDRAHHLHPRLSASRNNRAARPHVPGATRNAYLIQGDVHGPDLVGTCDRQVAQQIGVDLVSRRRFRGVGLSINGLDPHPLHQRRDMPPAGPE